MKRGFQDTDGTNRVCIPMEQQNLYGALDQASLEDLRTGFGGKVWEVYRDHLGDFKPRLLRQRSGPSARRGESELDHIIDLLYDLT